MSRLRTLVVPLVILAFLVAPGAASFETPTVVVERFVTIEERSLRLSLFSNREAVYSIREHGEQVFFRRLLLDEKDYVVYLTAVVHDADAVVAAAAGWSVDDNESFGLLRLGVGETGMRELSYPRSALMELPMARLSAALDDLELVVAESRAMHESLRSWQPRRGDRVELISGGTAVVDDVRDDYLVVLEHEEVSVLEMVAVDRLPEVVSKVLERAP